MLTKAELNQIWELYEKAPYPRLADILQEFTLTEKQRNQQVLDANFLRQTKRERKVKKFSRKDRNHNANKAMYAELLVDDEWPDEEMDDFYPYASHFDDPYFDPYFEPYDDPYFDPYDQYEYDSSHRPCPCCGL